MNTSIFISMEMQNGTNRLEEALLLRGFPVEVKDDFITLRNGTRQDYEELKVLLDKLHIPVFWNGDQFQLLVNRFPLQKMGEIIHYKEPSTAIYAEGYHFKWRSFANRRYGIRTNTLGLCPYTAMVVNALNEVGIVTLSGCNGHGHHSPKLQLSGIYFGVWFALIQMKYLHDLTLHYHWKVALAQDYAPSRIVAHKSSNEDWDMMQILSDCKKMTHALHRHAADIRKLKQKCFKRGMKEEAEVLRLSGDYCKLYNWMERIIQLEEKKRVK